MNIVNRTLLAAGAIAFTVMAASAQIGILPLDTPDSLTITGPNNFSRIITVAPGGEIGATALAALDLPTFGPNHTPFFAANTGVTVLYDPNANGTFPTNITSVAELIRAGGTVSDAFGFFAANAADTVTTTNDVLVETVFFGFISDADSGLLGDVPITPIGEFLFVPENGNGSYSGDRFLSAAAVEANYHVTFNSDVNVPDTATTAILFAIGLGGVALLRRKVASCS